MGSEMCIRDRPYRVELAIRPPVVVAAFQQASVTPAERWRLRLERERIKKEAQCLYLLDKALPTAVR